VSEPGRPDEVLAVLAGLAPLRRVLLATAGTLQGTLAAWFGEPVDVRLVSQAELDGGKRLLREVELVGRGSGKTVCRAASRIEVDDAEIAEAIREGRLGLGQICEQRGLRTSFVLESAGEDAACFWRRYRLEGPGFRYAIREEFPAALYDGDARGR
jgi:hypothetical protein